MPDAVGTNARRSKFPSAKGLPPSRKRFALKSEAASASSAAVRSAPSLLSKMVLIAAREVIQAEASVSRGPRLARVFSRAVRSDASIVSGVRQASSTRCAVVSRARAASSLPAAMSASRAFPTLVSAGRSLPVALWYQDAPSEALRSRRASRRRSRLASAPVL